MNYYSLTERILRMGVAGTFSLWSAHVETRRATSPRGKHSDAKCLNYELGDYMRTMIYLRSSRSRRDDTLMPRALACVRSKHNAAIIRPTEIICRKIILSKIKEK